jgi:RimJ/RimL family protein N-acetyltransferase
VWFERDGGALVARCGPRLALLGGVAEVEIHWSVRADRRRRGLAVEAAEAAIAACFDGLAVDSVTALTHVENAASERVARALGFTPERVVEHHGAPHRLHRRGRGRAQPAASGLPVARPGSSSGPAPRDVSGASVPPAPDSGPWSSPPRGAA